MRLSVSRFTASVVEIATKHSSIVRAVHSDCEMKPTETDFANVGRKPLISCNKPQGAASVQAISGNRQV